jgi:hypothetical protein
VTSTCFSMVLADLAFAGLSGAPWIKLYSLAVARPRHIERACERHPNLCDVKERRA